MNKLNIGCGTKTLEGWINLDASWNALLAKHPIIRRVLKALHILPKKLFNVPWSSNILFRDARKPLPFKDNSLSVIYTRYFWDHLFLEDAKRLLRECFRVLKPGGILRVIAHDLRAFVLEYTGEKNIAYVPEDIKTKCRADRFNKRLEFNESDLLSRSILYRIYLALTNLQSHKWLYDSDSLTMYFEQAGFEEVKQMQCCQSRIENIKEIEDPKCTFTIDLCIEGIKPIKD